MAKAVTVTRYESADGTLHDTQASAQMHDVVAAFERSVRADQLNHWVDTDMLITWLIRNRLATETFYKDLDKLK